MDGAALEVAAKKRIEMANFIFLLLFLLRSWDDWGCLQMAWGNVSYTHVCRHSVFPVLAPVFLRAPVQGSSRSYISSAPQSSIIGGINFRACLRTSRYISTLQKKFNDLVGKYGAWRQALKSELYLKGFVIDWIHRRSHHHKDRQRCVSMCMINDHGHKQTNKQPSSPLLQMHPDFFRQHGCF